MITFKEYLTEARMAPLYHSTTISAANKIIKDNTLYGTVQDSGATQGQKVIFVTRSIRHAEHYTAYNANYTASAILVLDQAKLAARYKIKPVKNWHKERADYEWDVNDSKRAKKLHLPMYQTRVMGANEFEEIILGGKIDNIANYITKIYVNRDVSKTGDFPYLRDNPKVDFKEVIVFSKDVVR